MPRKHYFTGEDSLAEFAREFAHTLKSGAVLALTGELGTGKTTFTKYLARALHVKNAVTSPTFTLAREYTGLLGKQKITLYHLDAYRLKNIDEAWNLGIADWFNDKNGIVIIEWADKIKSLLPAQTVWLNFEHTDDPAARHLTIQKNASK